MSSRLQNNLNPTTADVFDGLRSDYSAAKHNRFRRRRTGVAASGSHADYHYRNDGDYLRMMEQARDMARNDAIVGQTIERAVTNTVQGGIPIDPQTGDDDTNKILQELWQEWSQDADACDAAGEATFPDMEEMALTHQFVDGDVFANPTQAGQLEMIEGHRVRTPMRGSQRATTKNVVHGILLDSLRRRVEVWVTKDDIPPDKVVSRVGDLHPLRVRNSMTGERQVFQVYNPKRFSQTRGVTALAPIVDLLGMYEDVQFAKLVQSQIVSCFAIFHQREAEFDLGVTGQQEGPQQTETIQDGSSRLVEGISPGMRITGRPGEKLLGFSPNVPNTEFFPHMKLIASLVGVNLGLPYVMMMLDASETNFSGWRGAIDQARLGFRRNQRHFIRRFHRPVYTWKVREWLRKSPLLRSREKAFEILRHCWNAPTWPYIEPLKDAKADVIRLDNRLISPRRQQAERGNDYETMASEIVEDFGLIITNAKAKAREMNQDVEDESERVTWRDLTRFDAPRTDSPLSEDKVPSHDNPN